MMKILYVSNFDTTACRTGAECRSFWVRRALESFADVDTVDLTRLHLSRHIQLRDLWTVPLRKISAQCTFPWYSDDFYRQCINGKKYDAIVVRYSFIAACIGAWRFGIPCFLDIDDLPEQLCESGWERLFVRLWQRWLYAKCAGCWVSNSEQVMIVAKSAPCIPLPNIANGPSHISPVDMQRHILLSVGSMKHPPNVSGVERFIEKVWPTIKERFPDAEYWVVGGGCPVSTSEKWSRIDGVRVLGFVEELAAVYAAASVVVCPIETGSGTCVKTVEAVMYGRICIGPPFAFRGWTTEQKSQRFLSIAEMDKMSDVIIDALTHVQSRYCDTPPADIAEWARANFGELSFNDAARKLLCN